MSDSFTITLADGRVLDSVRVQGCGGATHDLERNARLATRGRPMHIYEPKPGHALVYHGSYKPTVAEEHTEVVDIRGATFAAAKESP